MNKIFKIGTNCLVLCVLSALFFSSCSPKVKAVYFTDLDSVQVQQIAGAPFTEPLIQTDDILSISVQTIDPAASMAVNQTPVTATAGIMNSASGFLVDKKGNVEIPMLGIVKVAGLTTADAKEVIRTEAEKYYKNPTIQVRFANYKITVIGEVAKPASYTVPNEKVTVLDAIAMAGDLTIYGKRDNVMLIRDEGGKKEVVRLDLTSAKTMSSPYFYMKQNDVLYVEPGKGKIAANNLAKRQTITLVLSSLSVLIAILTRL